jgi:hypothetical protein
VLGSERIRTIVSSCSSCGCVKWPFELYARVLEDDGDGVDEDGGGRGVCR